MCQSRMELVWMFILLFNGYHAVAHKQECARECVIFNIPHVLCAPDVSKVSVTPHYDLISFPQCKNLLADGFTVPIDPLLINDYLTYCCSVKPKPCPGAQPPLTYPKYDQTNPAVTSNPEVKTEPEQIITDGSSAELPIVSPKHDQTNPAVTSNPEIKTEPEQIITDGSYAELPIVSDKEEPSPQTTQEAVITTSATPSEEVQPETTIQSETLDVVPVETPVVQTPEILSPKENKKAYCEESPKITCVPKECEIPILQNSATSSFVQHKTLPTPDCACYPPFYANPRYIYELSSLYSSPPRFDEDFIAFPHKSNCYTPCYKIDQRPSIIATKGLNKENPNVYAEPLNSSPPPPKCFQTPAVGYYGSRPLQYNKGYYDINRRPQCVVDNNPKLIPVPNDNCPGPIYVDPIYTPKSCRPYPLQPKEPCYSTEDFDIDFTKCVSIPQDYYSNGKRNYDENRRSKHDQHQQKTQTMPKKEESPAKATSTQTQLPPPDTKQFDIDFTMFPYQSTTENSESESNGKEKTVYPTNDGAEEETGAETTGEDKAAPVEIKAADETISPDNSEVKKDYRW